MLYKQALECGIIVVQFTNMDTAPLPLGTIKAAFSELKRLVSSDLRMQQGDAARLSARKQDCHRLLQLLQQVRWATVTR